jgi:predicted DsbA family dithiol-disulfide isomerase
MAGLEEDIGFDFDKIKKSPNTIDSHRLIRWALNEGCQDEMIEILFKLYFEDGEDIGDRQVLLKAAEHVGMDVELVDGLLASDADRDLIAQEIAQAREIGVQGVPTYIFDNKYVLTGAQEPHVLVSAIEQIVQEAGQVEAKGSN